MALFSSKPKSTQLARKAAVNTDGRLSNVLTKPWLSEKALIGTEAGVYVFEVPPSATKTDVAAAVEAIYKVAPRKVRMVNLPAKRKALRTRRGLGAQAARHKAYVYLKKGEAIQFA
ncbi:50S ribosomal protein L23 [Patescibacteria group bacterium]|nr:50S ribosomal protein L23 [Patescibacteria group bacterium]MBU1755285.1 50S ribosomal protein L23 [Patescibacteria group bacterium]